VSTDTASIDTVRLLQVIHDSATLREVTIRQVQVREEGFRLRVDTPADDAHLSGIPKSAGLLFDLVFLAGSMDEIVTRFTQRDEIVRTIPARLPTLDMVHIEDLVFRFPLAPLAGVLIAKQYILTDVPEPQLRTFLVFLSLDVGMLDPLEVKLCHLNRRLADW
jgi:hypothetical protein